MLDYTYSLPQSGRTVSKADHEAAINASLRALADRIDALSTGVFVVGEWDATSGGFPTTRPDSSPIQAGDVWFVATGGTVDGETFALGDRLLALGDGGGATYSGNWLRLQYADLLDDFAPLELQTVALLVASATPARGVGAVWRAQGFGFLEAAPGASDHHLTTAGGVKLYAQPDAGGTLSPIQFGAVGDGVTDDLASLNLTLNEAAATGSAIVLGPNKQYGISAPWQFNSSHSFVKVVGSTTLTQNDDSESFPVSTIKKLSGFVGAAAIIVNSPTTDPATDPMCVATLFESFGIDGNGQSGDGMQWWVGGRHTAIRVSAYDHPNGWGFRCDGVFFPRFLYCVSRLNGTNGNANSGGFLGSNDIRENADGKWSGGYINLCGNRCFRLAPRGVARPEDSQTGWVVEDTEFWFGVGYEGASDADAPFTAEISGAWLSTFRKVKFIGGNASQHAYCLLLSNSSGGALDNCVFDECYFQQASFAGSGVTKFCIYFADPRGGTAGAVDQVEFNSAFHLGNAKFMDASPLSSADSIFLNSPRVAPESVNDPDFIVQNLRGGLMGLRYGTGDDTFLLANRSEGGAISFQTTASTGLPGNTIVGRFLFADDEHLMAKSYWQYLFPVHRQSTKMTTAQIEAFMSSPGFEVADELWWTGGTAPSGTTGFTTAGKYICTTGGGSPVFAKMH